MSDIISKAEADERLARIQEGYAKAIAMLASGEIKLTGVWGTPTTPASAEVLIGITDTIRTGKDGAEMRIPDAVLKKHRAGE